jgi:hypothetical protein
VSASLDFDLGAVIAPRVNLGRAIFFFVNTYSRFGVLDSRVPDFVCAVVAVGRDLKSFVSGKDGRTWVFRGGGGLDLGLRNFLGLDLIFH